MGLGLCCEHRQSHPPTPRAVRMHRHGGCGGGGGGGAGGGAGERLLLGHASSKQLKPKAAEGLNNSAAEQGYALKLMRTKRGHFISRAVLARIILFPNPAATRSMQGQN